MFDGLPYYRLLWLVFHVLLMMIVTSYWIVVSVSFGSPLLSAPRSCAFDKTTGLSCHVSCVVRQDHFITRFVACFFKITKLMSVPTRSLNHMCSFEFTRFYGTKGKLTDHLVGQLVGSSLGIFKRTIFLYLIKFSDKGKEEKASWWATKMTNDMPYENPIFASTFRFMFWVFWLWKFYLKPIIFSKIS